MSPKKTIIDSSVRFLTVVALAVWFGGFTFYSTAVIDTSQKVLHSQLRAGLITQQVTNWLNQISIPTLAICAWNWLSLRRHERKFRVLVLGASLLGMILFQLALFPTHSVLDGRIVNREVADEAAFFPLHRLYLVLSTAQWCATLVYLWAALALWTENNSQPRGLRELTATSMEVATSAVAPVASAAQRAGSQ
jgi:hypothetical protein